MDSQGQENVNVRSKKKNITRKWWFWVIISVVGIIIFSALVSDDPAQDEAEESAQITTTLESTEEITQIDEAAYKAQCEWISYFQLSHYPDKYVGKDIKLLGGQVEQVIEDKNNYTLLVNVSKDEYGLYTDTVYVTYTKKASDARILEGDEIYIYGRFEGLITYDTVIGGSVSVPGVEAKYVNVY